MAHGLLYVGKGNLHYIDYQINHHRPDAWKGYNIAGAAKVDSDPQTPMVQWRHDDEKVAYPTFELISQNVNAGRLGKGGNVISVHKGLARGLPPKAENGYPSDLPKALKDWPNLNFVTYHSCIQDSFFDDQAFAEIRASEAGTRPLMAGVPKTPLGTPFAGVAAGFKNTFRGSGNPLPSSVVSLSPRTAPTPRP